MSRSPLVADEDLPTTNLERRAGRWLQTVVLGAATWVVVMSLLAVVLAGLGVWFPWLVLPLAVVAAGASGWWAHGIPARSLPVWTAALLVAVCAGAGIWTAATHSEQVLPRRDSASYLQTAISMAETHRRVVPVDPADVGGPEVLALDGVTLSSPAFYEVDSWQGPSVQPQFVIGPGAVWSLGVWLGGPTGAMLLPALASAIGLLGMGLLLARCGAPRWSPVAAAGVALLFPVLHTARSTYSEPLAMVTLGGGLLALTVASHRSARGEAGRAALLAGVLIGGTAFVRIDGLRETILLVPVAALALAQGHRWMRTTLLGAAVSTALAVLSALWLSNEYLGTIAASLVPLVALGVLMGSGTAALLWWQRRGGAVPQAISRRLPDALGLAVVLVGLFLASRPLWQTVRQSPDDPGSRVVAGLQLRQGLAVDGGRTYAEQTVAWLSWWVGVPALVIALAALAWSVRTAATCWTRGERLPSWTGALLIAAGSTVLTLWRPGITPDHPWAERRLLIALPFVVVLCVAAAAYAVRHLSRRAPVLLAVAAGVALLLATLVPTAAATWPHRSERVELGELAAVDGVCRQIGPDDVVLAVDSRAANEWPQVVRGQCGRPALSTTNALRRDPVRLAETVTTIQRALEPSGRRLVLLAADSPEALETLGVTSRLALDTTVLEDMRLLERRPDHLVTLPLQVWLGTGPVSGG
ncbi:hypothetical protein N798_11190 [Knoellia flava TL1]|uniref:Uncharacterized protein n=2 Tax=Knoellia flava TaxID=913969 RepID=A0A8H9KT86_9MICO|nr:hypothetical protein [Knoellia flava]KGN30259.1 hypothetical protein N798_11190 [Knoellia flava TL1]GGB84554.1 hypothetical protein GCM10011314_25260 [Knoellia flava]